MLGLHYSRIARVTSPTQPEAERGPNSPFPEPQKLIFLSPNNFSFCFPYGDAPEIELKIGEREIERKMETKNKYSIIVPTYNERLNIALLVYLVFKHLR